MYVLYRDIFEFLCKTVFPNSLQLSPFDVFGSIEGTERESGV